MNIVIGKNVIENLTTGMYEDPKIIFREYIQNSADQIDKAIETGLLKQGEGYIDINLDYQSRKISIKDNATGISKENFIKILSDIANSEKDRDKDKGFRGIGRLGGLAYCEKLIFKSSFYGEETESEMIWDGLKLKEILNDNTNKIEAAELIKEIITTNLGVAHKDEHYFEVILERIYEENNELLHEKEVEQYLQAVAPVPYASSFYFRSEIKKYADNHNFKIDEYSIYLNGKEILKPYRIDIYEGDINNKKICDKIKGLQFEIIEYDNTIYGWMWYGVSRFEKQMQSINIMRGIRLRKENIQIGDEEICKKFFTKTEDQRFSFYFFGEIHAVSKGLIPNSRRDYFGESDTLKKFERLIKEDFCKLKDLCYDASKYRNAQSTIAKTEEIRQEIQKKEKEGYTSTAEKESLQKKLEDHQKKDIEARKQLERIQKKMEESNSPLLPHLSQLTTASVVKDTTSINETSAQPSSKTKYRTDGPKYSSYDKKSKKLISRIYESIKNYLPEGMSEPLIQKIEEDLTR